MKTMELLTRRFNRLNPGYHADLDWRDSYAGWYTVYIMGHGCSTRYHFSTCADFREWMDGVVLD